jgi:hypothetical protein
VARFPYLGVLFSLFQKYIRSPTKRIFIQTQKKIVLLQVKQHELSIIFPDKKRKVKKLAGDRESKSVPARKAPGNPPTKGNQNESDFTHADAPKPNHESRVYITRTCTLSAGHAGGYTCRPMSRPPNYQRRARNATQAFASLTSKRGGRMGIRFRERQIDFINTK